MGFKNRNLYYLRVTHKIILPLYVYLDEQHTSWMSDYVLQRMLLDLRPHVLSKLSLDTVKTVTGKVDTLQGDGYQFCYFFRNVGNQSILAKKRFYAAEVVSTNPTQSGKRKARPKDTACSDDPQKSKRKRRGTQTRVADEPATGVSQQEDTEIVTGPGDDTMSENSPVLDDDDFMNTDTILEEKPKPRMQLKYEGFRISSQSLCVVVEPLHMDELGSSPTTLSHEAYQSNQEPLFLPEQETNLIAALPPDTGRGMMTLSQRLHTISTDYTTSLVDDGSEGEVFLGDADEARGY